MSSEPKTVSRIVPQSLDALSDEGFNAYIEIRTRLVLLTGRPESGDCEADDVRGVQYVHPNDEQYKRNQIGSNYRADLRSSPVNAITGPRANEDPFVRYCASRYSSSTGVRADHRIHHYYISASVPVYTISYNPLDQLTT
jgi:hypothetical protein